MQQRETTVKSVEEMDHYAKEWLLTQTPGERAVVWGLHGDLGAGKTTFVQCVARHLGITEGVTSPTFVIQKTYTTTHELFTALVHIDAYRLESARELEVLGFASLLQQPRTLIMVEWPEKVSPLLDAVPTISFSHPEGNVRVLTIDESRGQ